MNNVHDSLSNLLVDIDTLVPLPGNPRVGDPKAIASSLHEFGQVKPIVIRPNDDGTATVLAGNHTVEAARQLGWDQLAAVAITDMDDIKARLFALTDNRINELGSTNEQLLHESLMMIMDDYSDYLEVLGWDEFELAAIDSSSYLPPVEVDLEPSVGFTPPVLLNNRTERPVSHGSTAEGKSEPSRIAAPESIDSRDVIARGSSAGGHSGAKVVVQYTIVFDSAEHQRRWYDFIRWLKADPGTDGDTTSERLINFIDAHVNI